MIVKRFGPDVRERPIAAGLLWAAVTLPLIQLLMLAGGQAFSELRLALLAVQFVPAGLALGYVARWATLREDARAR